MKSIQQQCPGLYPHKDAAQGIALTRLELITMNQITGTNVTTTHTTLPSQPDEALRRARLLDRPPATPEVTFATLPAGEVLRVDRVDGVLRVVVDNDQVLAAPRVTFGVLPAGELVRCHRVGGVLHVTVDADQIRHTATEQVTG